MCLELSKCGRSGPQSLYQCQSSPFPPSIYLPRDCSFPLSLGKSTLSPWMAQQNCKPFTSNAFLFKNAFCLKGTHIFFPLVYHICRNAETTEKMPHVTSSARYFCSLNIWIVCGLSGSMMFLERSVDVLQAE